MTGIKEKASIGFFWSLLDNSLIQIINLVVGVVLARLLSPAEFGIIGMITVFIAISETIVDSGLSQALIRKKDCRDIDYNTVFIANLLMGVALYAILFVSANAISVFYKRAELSLLTRVMAFNLIINSFGIVETAKLTKNIEFKLQTKISIVSEVSSGILSVLLAALGFSYWSLAIKTLVRNLVRVVQLHYYSGWRPKLQFSFGTLKWSFNFGSKLLLSELINTGFRNLYYLVIGKFFSAQELGLYTKANRFSNLASANFERVVQRVSYPVLVKVSSDVKVLKEGYKRLMSLSFFVSILFTAILMVNSKEIILLTIGEKWSEAIPFMQMLCLANMPYIVQALNGNIFKTRDRTDLMLKSQIYLRILMIPVVVIGVLYGIKTLLIGLTIHSLASYLVVANMSGKLIEYSIKEQLKDLLPIALYIGVAVSISVLLTGIMGGGNLVVTLLFKTIMIICFTVFIGEILSRPEYRYSKDLVVSLLIKAFGRSKQG